jgi:hypothetical protein
MKFSRSDVINEIEIDLRGGAALVDIITRLQDNEEYRDLPGLFWDLIIQGSCSQLGDQCTGRVYETILEGYIPVSEDVAEDIMLTSNDFNQWLLLLNTIGLLVNAGSTELREMLADGLVTSLEKIVREPLYEATGESMEQYLKRRGGLPVRQQSPLFQYSLDQLKSPDLVPNCELNLLSKWIYYVTQILGIVRDGNRRPMFQVQSYDGRCSSPTVKKIPVLSEDPKPANIGKNPKMRYDHAFQKAHIYWVPEEYLP